MAFDLATIQALLASLEREVHDSDEDDRMRLDAAAPDLHRGLRWAVEEVSWCQNRVVELECETASLTMIVGERDAEIEQLRSDLKKPVARAWVRRGPIWERDCGDALGTAVSEHGWRVWTLWTLNVESKELAHGPETGDAGKNALDLYLETTHYLVGGVHPVPAGAQP